MAKQVTEGKKDGWKKTNIALIATVVVVIVLSLLFLLPAPSPIQCDFDHTNHSEYLYLEIETDKEVYERGEEVLISIFLVNEGDEDFSFYYGGRSWRLVVYNSAGEEIVDSINWPDTPDVNLHEVPAHSQVVLESNFSWDQTPDPIGDQTDEPLPVDCYRLRFSIEGNTAIFGEIKILIA